MKPILIVDDERPIAELIELTLQKMGYACQLAFDGDTAADLMEQNEYDLVLLDIMLPEPNGYELLEYLRPTGTPVIFLTAKGTVSDRVRGLRLGADDYIVKPFDPMELLARVESVLRRAGRGDRVLKAWDVAVDPTTHTVTKNGVPVSLTPREYDLLMVLLHNRGVVFYRDILYERVWGTDSDLDTRTLDVHISRLRKKLGWNGHIRTVSKVGYLLEGEV